MLKLDEYGGYLPFDFKTGKEQFEGYDFIRLNSARNGLIYSILDGGYDKVYIPYYMCQSIQQVLKKNNIPFGLYHINEAFMPVNVELKDRECIFYPNYYGLFSEKDLKVVVDKYEHVILDQTQAFFCKPIADVYNIYSCRKFIGVSDGAYVIKKNIGQLPIKKDKSWTRIVQLFRSVEEGTGSAYQDYLLSEQEIENSEILEMSDITYKMLLQVDYDSIRRTRQKNFDALATYLKDKNIMNVLRKNECTPMIYPFQTDMENMRQCLVEHHIYVPFWWKYLLEYSELSLFERKLIEELMPLPIDQRYNESDMEYLANIVKSLMK